MLTSNPGEVFKVIQKISKTAQTSDLFPIGLGLIEAICDAAVQEGERSSGKDIRYWIPRNDYIERQFAMAAKKKETETGQ